MSHWNHRVMRQTIGEEVFDGIHEVYYNDDDVVTGWTKNAMDPSGLVGDDSDYSIRDDVLRFLKACDKPILDYATGKEIK